jgi:hypothetical protein
MSALPLRLSPLNVLVSSAAQAQRPLVALDTFARMEAELRRRADVLELVEDGEGFIAVGDYVGLYVVSRRERQVTLLELTRRLPSSAARPVLVR